MFSSLTVGWMMQPLIDITCPPVCCGHTEDRKAAPGGLYGLMHTGLWRLVNGRGLLLHHRLISTCREEEVCRGMKSTQTRGEKANAHSEQFRSLVEYLLVVTELVLGRCKQRGSCCCITLEVQHLQSAVPSRHTFSSCFNRTLVT